MNVFQAAVLGILQGLAEFLPISSSGHLELCQHLMGLSGEGSEMLLLSVLLHAGTLIAVIVGVTNVIPFFGPFIGAIPSAFIIFIVDPIKMLWFALIILIIQQLDGNVIGPKILGQSTGLSSLGVIVAITVMSGLLGLVGMFIGVPLFSLLYMLFNRLVDYLLARKEAAKGEDAP